jgi:RNA polymerase-binding transcription factor DksA
VLGVVTQSPNPILPSTGEIIWSVISFAILLALLVKFAFPPVAGMLQKRSEKIRTDLEAAEAARREAEALAAQLREALAAVERALAKIDDGTYGICERCGKPISVARLEAKPASRYCIDCASVRR